MIIKVSTKLDTPKSDYREMTGRSIPTTKPLLLLFLAVMVLFEFIRQVADITIGVLVVLSQLQPMGNAQLLLPLPLRTVQHSTEINKINERG